MVSTRDELNSVYNYCFASNNSYFEQKKRKTKMLGYRGRQMPNLERKNLSQTDCQLLYSLEKYYCVNKKQIKSLG